MAVRSNIADGEGSGYKAGVTGDHALKVAVLESRAADLPIAVLTLRKQFRGFLTDAGSTDLNVDGSVTPVEFQVSADVSNTRWITAARILLNGVNMEIDTNDFRRFGAAATAPGLTNGLDFFIEQTGVTTDLTLDAIKKIGDFMDYEDGFENLINSVGTQEDFLSVDFVFDVPVVLPPGSSDRIVMRVNDDLTPIDLFKVLVRGYQEIGT